MLISCGERCPVGRTADARYLEDGSNKGLVNLDKINSQDFTRAANQLIGDLLTSGALTKAPTQPAILHVGEVRNDTQTYFDTDLLLQGMKRDLAELPPIGSEYQPQQDQVEKAPTAMLKRSGRIWMQKERKSIVRDLIFHYPVK